jgi:hypothetical protein
VQRATPGLAGDFAVNAKPGQWAEINSSHKSSNNTYYFQGAEMFNLVTIARLSAMAAALAAAAPAAAVNLVTNGGFETGSFSGWTQFGALGQSNVNTADAITGSYGGRFSPNSPGGGIKQSFATVAGTSYLITFDLKHAANRLAPNNDFTVSFDGGTLTSLANVGVMPVTSYSFTALASSALTELKFTFRDNRNSPANRWSIDDISVDALGRNTGGVPEPASWAMLVVGFALIGQAARRRRPMAAVGA